MTQQEVAIKAMRKLKIFTPYIKEFQENGRVCLFRSVFGYYIDQDNEPELYQKIKEFEQETGSLVYAVTQDGGHDEEIYSFLCVSKYEEEWGTEIDYAGNYIIVWAYVWNKSYEPHSEFGSIGVRSAGGGVFRIY